MKFFTLEMSDMKADENYEKLLRQAERQRARGNNKAAAKTQEMIDSYWDI